MRGKREELYEGGLGKVPVKNGHLDSKEKVRSAIWPGKMVHEV